MRCFSPFARKMTRKSTHSSLFKDKYEPLWNFISLIFEKKIGKTRFCNSIWKPLDFTPKLNLRQEILYKGITEPVNIFKTKMRSHPKLLKNVRTNKKNQGDDSCSNENVQIGVSKKNSHSLEIEDLRGSILFSFPLVKWRGAASRTKFNTKMKNSDVSAKTPQTFFWHLSNFTFSLLKVKIFNTEILQTMPKKK